MWNDFLTRNLNTCLSQLKENSFSKFSISSFENRVDISVCNFIVKIENTGSQIESQECLQLFITEFDKLLTTSKSFPVTRESVFIELITLYNVICCHLYNSNLTNDTTDEINILISETLNRVYALLTKKTSTSCFESISCPFKILQLITKCIIQKKHLLQIYNLLVPCIIVICVWCYVAVINKKYDIVQQVLELLQTVSLDKEKIPAPRNQQLFVPLPIKVFKDVASEDVEDGDSLILVSDIINYLSTIVYYKLALYDKCLTSLNLVIFKDWLPWTTLVKVLILYTSGKYNEVITTCQQILYIDKQPILNTTRSYLLNILGTAQSKQGKTHLAIESFREALSEDFTYLPSLYNISLQYNILQLYDAELESLNFLLMTLEDNEGKTIPNKFNLLEISWFLEFPNISLLQSAYKLASRCLQLHRYEEASEKYLDVISLITDSNYVPPYNQKNQTGDNLYIQENTITVPSPVIVYLETCQSLVHTNKLDQCVILCDAALTSLSNDEEEEEEDGIRSPCTEEADEFDDLFDDEASSRKRSRSDSTSRLNDKKWEDVHYAGQLMSFKAEALEKLHKLEDASHVLIKVIETLQEFSTSDPEWKIDTSTGKEQTSSPQAKRRRISLTGEHISDDVGDDAGDVSQQWQYLMWTSCHKLSYLLLSQSNYQDAIHFTRLSLQLRKDSAECWYIYVCIFKKLDQEREGYRSWLEHRQLLPISDYLFINNQLKMKQRLLEESKDQSELNKFIKMDIDALQYWLKNR